MEKLKSALAGTVLVFFFSCAELFSQVLTFKREINTIPIIINGDTIANSFGGGFSGFTTPAFVDIDDDGDYDLFVGELDGHISFYKNKGDSIKPRFTIEKDSLASTTGFIDVGSYSAPAFVDIDADEDFDLFVGQFDGDITFYRNIGNPTNPVFVFEQERFRDIALDKYSTPTFADIDKNGTFDLFVGTGSGIYDGQITLYKNTGTPKFYKFDTSEYGFASIDVGSNSTPFLAKLNDDDFLDLLVGASDGSVDVHLNNGTASNPSFASTPDYSTIVDVGERSAPAVVDINDDGFSDLFVGEGNSFSQEDNINFYRNSGQALTQSLRNLVTEKLVAIFDVGKRSTPAFADINMDGKKDLFVGESDGNVSFYENTGTRANPAFTFRTENFAAVKLSFSAPTFEDINKDGDFDLFVGEIGGKIKRYDNMGTPNFDFAPPVDVGPFVVGSYSTPTFVDIQKDNDFDLLVGESGSNINFFRNIGGATNPIFVLAKDSLFNITVGSSSAPTFKDIDNDGDFDLFVGESGGTIKFFENNGAATDSIPTFKTSSINLANIDVGNFSAPAFEDIDDDGDLDLFVGENGGSLYFYRNETPVIGNRPPVVVNAIPNQTLAPGGAPFTRNLNSPAVFTDPDSDMLIYTASSSDTTIAKASISGSTLTVASVAVGNATITVTANDGKGGIVSAPFTVTVSVANRSPTVANVISNQNLILGGPVFTRDLNAAPAVFNDPDGNVLTYTASSSANSVATASISGSRLTVAPLARGSATITVTANDNRGGIVSTTFMVTTTGNRPPVVANTISNRPLTVGVAFTLNLTASPPAFSDPDGDVLTFTVSSNATNIATANVSGSTLTVSPVSVGSATITVTARDDSGGTASTLFTVMVVTGNRPPVVASPIPNQTLTVGGASFARNLNVSPAVFNDPDGDALTYTANSSATNIATANISGSTLTVAPVAVGNATITITANDGRGGTVSTTFTVTVGTAPNRAPTVANAISNQILTVGGTSFTRNLNAAPAVFSDLDGDALTYIASSSAASIATANISGSTLTVAPVAVGTATITVTANDGKNGMASTMFMVTVGTALNRAPAVASAISNQTLNVGGTSFTRDLNASPAVFSDPDSDPLTYTASSSAANIATVDLSGTAIIVAPVDAGSATITVTANDGKGGAVSTTFVVAVNRNQPPNVTHTAPLSAPRGQNIFIVVSVTDDRGINKVDLNYRDGGNLNFTSTQMTPVSGTNNYQATIPASVVTSRGVEYFIIATDMDNEMARNPSAANGIFSIQIQVTSETRRDAQGNVVTQPSGSAATAYRLISVPLQLDNPSANAVLEDDLGPYDNTEWRLFGLNPIPAQDLNIKTPYLEFRTGGDLSPGKSLFLIVADPGKMITIDAARSMRTDQEFQIPLQRGHNFIGTPFNFDIPKTKLRLSSGSPVIDLQTYAGSWVTENMKLLTWEGYYLPNNRATADILLVNPNLSSSTAAPMAEKAEAGWRIRLSAHCSEAADTHNFAGVSPASEDGWDDHDLVEAPPIGDYVSLYFPHVEWRKVFERYREDMRSTGNPNQRWRFIVESNIPNAMVTLRFEGLKDIEANLAIFLVDEALKYKQNLREDAVYQYQPRRNEFTKTFTLVVGKEEFVAGQTAGVQGAPENFVLEQNFPNPFNPETAIRFGLPQQSFVTIKIYDLAGREIATLLDRVELPAGRHQRVWDGRDAQGRVVVSGIYFYRLVAGSFITTKKLTLMQ